MDLGQNAVEQALGPRQLFHSKMVITKMQWVVENTYNPLSQKFKWADRRTGPPYTIRKEGIKPHP
jgi:hypothetical protein